MLCQEQPLANWSPLPPSRQRRRISASVQGKETTVDRDSLGYRTYRRPIIGISQARRKEIAAALSRMEWEKPRATPDEESFIHAGWADARARIRAGIAAAGMATARLQRWDTCGSLAFVFRNRETGKCIVRHTRCKDRFCRTCSTHVRRQQCGKLLRLCEDAGCVRLLTLTLKHQQSSLAQMLDRLYECFRKLRHRHAWKAHVQAAAAACEITLADDGAWHVHLHVLLKGVYWHQAEIKAEWLAVTGDSSIVDIRAVRDVRAVHYVTKYLGKAIPANVTNDPEKLVDAIKSLHGRRMLIVCGDWIGALKDDADIRGDDGEIDPDKLEKMLQTRRLWVPIGALTAILARAKSGCRVSKAIIEGLRNDRRENNEGTGHKPPD